MCPRVKMTEARRHKNFWVYMNTRPNLVTEVVFIFPVLLFYHFGTHLTPVRNGVDLVSVLLAELYARVPWTVFAVNGLLVALFFVFYLSARKKEDFKIRMFGAVFLESLVYALTMGTVIVVLMVFVFRIKPPGLLPGTASEWFDILFISAGAGLHEELVFRLLIFGGMVYLLEEHTSVSSFWAVLLGLAVSSVLFALAHHVPPHGEPLGLWPLVYRILAGVFFGILYRYRGLSIAVYTHMFYDVYVLGWLA